MIGNKFAHKTRNQVIIIYCLGANAHVLFVPRFSAFKSEKLRSNVIA